LNGGGLTATFASNPLRLQNGDPLPNAPFTHTLAGNGLSLTLIDANLSDGDQGEFSYFIDVEFDGQPFSHDPVIINEPPVPPEG
jgi:hypothetical protein